MTPPTLRLVGQRAPLPVLGGGSAPGLHLDVAASAPALEAVHAVVEAFLPWYSSVHRGAGWVSRVSTEAYELAREEVARFVGARETDVVVFTRTTTDALNLLSTALPADTTVVTFGAEHHANLLPWRRRHAIHLPVPDDPADLAPMLDATLGLVEHPGPILFSVTAASNVTGEVWPVAELAAVARRHGARVCVDAAQLAPHAPIDITAWGADWVAFSGHKLYAPYGAGALVGARDWLDAGAPYLRGGGAVRFVTLDDVAWGELPDRQEAGSPNVVGAVALGEACRVLREYGMDNVAAHEHELEALAAARFADVPGYERLTLWGGARPRIGVLTGNIAGYHHGLVAAVLSAEHGISVRDGCFCAHPLVLKLLKVDEATAEQVRLDLLANRHARVPGAFRVSTGVATTVEDIDRVADALLRLVEAGPQWTYAQDDETGAWSPVPDDRAWPDLRGLLSGLRSRPASAPGCRS